MQYIKGKIKRDVNISCILRIFSIYKNLKIIKKTTEFLLILLVRNSITELNTIQLNVHFRKLC